MFLMNGGPATVYGARAFAAFCEAYDQHAGRGPSSGHNQPTGYEHGIGQPNGYQHVG